MQTVWLWIVILVLIIIIFIVFSLKSRTPKSILGTANNGYLCVTSSEDTLKEYIRLRINYLTGLKSALAPVNNNVIKELLYMLQQPDFKVENMTCFLTILPGKNYGFYPVFPIQLPSPVFQFEQGNIGWYWLYGTFPDSKSAFLMQISRFEILPPNLLKKHNIALGSSTLYQLSLQLTVGGKNYQCTKNVFGANYQIINEISFKMESQSGYDTSVYFSIQGGDFEIKINTEMFATLDPTDRTTLQLNIVGESTKPLYPDLPGGCAPCLFGDGTNYFSYTQLHMTGSATIHNTEQYYLQNGIGWMDHQWGGSEATSTIGKLITNITSGGKVGSVFPKYIWLNLHVSENLQYMIFTFPKNNPKVGDAFTCYYIEFTPDNITYLKNCQINILSTVLYPPGPNPVEYPTEILVTIGVNEYRIDGKPYGMSVFEDINDVPHWGGSADLYQKIPSGTGEVLIGTAFIESQKFISEKEADSRIWAGAGHKDSANISNWYSKQYNTGAYYYSLLILLVLFLIFILTWVMILRLYVKGCKTD